MNVQTLLIQLFEEAGYQREKQVRLKMFSFVGPAPGTYRFDRYYNSVELCRAYLTTKKNEDNKTEMCEFFVDGTMISVYWNFKHKKVVNLTDSDSIDQIREMIQGSE
jgi:hypothetical protein